MTHQPPSSSPDPLESPEEEFVPDPRSLFVQIGGHEAFRTLTTEFYERVAADPEFRAMYPEEDLEPARRRLEMFLEQYFGGPGAYGRERGHPRLRMRHHPFRIDSWARRTWLRCMRESLDVLELPPLQDGLVWDYFQRAALAMTNSPD